MFFCPSIAEKKLIENHNYFLNQEKLLFLNRLNVV
jgi:hypothetical protein